MALLNTLGLSFERETFKVLKKLVSNYSAAASDVNDYYFKKDYIRAWTVPSFGTLEKLQLSETTPVPTIKHHNDVVVKVHATSVNPIDVAMVGGYGNALLGAVRECDSLVSCSDELPSTTLIPGRDFAGEIIAKGSSVNKDLRIGDMVYGVVPPHRQGCHAELVTTNDYLVRRLPDGLGLAEAASLLYCGLTAWSALNITGDLYWSEKANKKALVIGGAGGVGSLAVQLLKAYKLTVVATCRNDAIPLLERLGADLIIDYTTGDAMHAIEMSGKYDIILNAAGNVTHYTYIPFLKDWANSKYITLTSPLLSNTDKFGLVPGMLKNVADLVKTNVISGAAKRGATLRWGYFLPMESGVDELHYLFSNKKIKPVLHKIFPFNELPEAYSKVKIGHNRGKVVLIMGENVNTTSQLRPT